MKCKIKILLVLALAAIVPASLPARAEERGDEDDPEDERVHYEIIIKLVWNEPVNLDLFVEEPGGDVASRHNTMTSGGGELGYIDSEGDWHFGDSGDNEAPEIYRARYGMEGEYSIHVFCNPGEADEEDEDGNGYNGDEDNGGQLSSSSEKRHVSAGAFTVVRLHGRYSEDAVSLRFPASGTQKVSSDENEGWWYAGSFTFTPDRDPRECFIMTASHGSPGAEEVHLLREFRENMLLESFHGRIAAGIYHRLSPAAAGVIERSGALRFLSRAHLKPLVKAVRLISPR